MEIASCGGPTLKKTAGTNPPRGVVFEYTCARKRFENLGATDLLRNRLFRCVE